MLETVTLKEWQEENENIYENSSASCRPKKGKHRKRSFEERRAMALSCKKAWDEWIASGFIVEIEKKIYIMP